MISTALTKASLLRALQDLPDDGIIYFEMPNGTTISVRSARLGVSSQRPLFKVVGVPVPPPSRHALILKG